MRHTNQSNGVRLILGAVILGLASLATADAADPFELRLRARVAAPGLTGRLAIVETPATWNPDETAIIVCDMWDLHHCLNAVRRGGELVPTMDRVLKTARSRGTTIIHAPSECTGAYAKHPARAHAINTPRSTHIPAEIGTWCYKIPSEEKGKYPIDQSDGGEDDDLTEHAAWAAKLTAMGRNPKAPWKTQADGLAIDNTDYISDNGEEIWSILEARGVKHVVLMGVHLNMCVLGRPFGLRQMAKNGMSVALMRDMTDTMYNPKAAPYVSHFAGTDLIVEHVEKFVCPTITSDQILGGVPFRFKDDHRPHVALLIADDEYRTEVSLPEFAASQLAKDYFVSYILAPVGQRDNLPGVNILSTADVALVSARRRVLPESQLAAIRKFVGDGKPVVGIRTASHAFAPKANAAVPAGHAAWTGFDADVLGGHYTGHHAENGPTVVVKVAIAPGAASDPILKGVDVAKVVGHGSLYKVSPLASTARPLLIGTIPDKSTEPVAWTNAPETKGRVVYTALGQIDDFTSPDFNRFLRNAIDWALAR
jgi:nicotinamidase-related amidase/type 1 glutamine amidotransferase